MTTIANCFDVNQALQLKLLLESVGISSFIPDEISADIVPYHFFTSSGVRLQVADEDTTEAQQIIAEAQAIS